MVINAQGDFPQQALVRRRKHGRRGHIGADDGFVPKWSFWQLLLYAIEGIVAFSTTPLVISSVFGLICCALALVMILVVIVRTLVFGDPTSGWPSLVCIMLLLSGIQMLGIGILGQYLAKTYLETKKRPIYLVRQTNIEKT